MQRNSRGAGQAGLARKAMIAVMARRAALVAALAMSGCALDDPERDAAAVGEPSALGGGQCPEFGCGANSPVIDVYGFHELSVVSATAGVGSTTMANKEGFMIEAVAGAAQITKAGTRYALTVQDGRFLGQSCARLPCVQLQGAALVGATIAILRGETHYQLMITGVRTMPYFLGAGTVEAYTLQWTAPGKPAKNLCSNISLLESLIAAQPPSGSGDVSDFATQELMGMRTFEAIVFEGDRIAKDSKKMSPGADDRWFNIGCAGHALSKLRLTRNTLHSQITTTVTTPQQAWQHRQATLRLLVADYCGNGTALTVAGQALIWRGDLMEYFGLPPNPELEARWNESGATCLHVPRLAHPTSPVGAAAFPDIRGSIRDACLAAGRPVPTDCTAVPDPYAFAGAFRVSANR